jgi:hypothetical protein
MKHLDDIELIEYVADNLSAAKLSDTLGLWEVKTAGHDVGDRVSAMAMEAQPESNRHPAMRTPMRKFLPQVLRVAASIIIAIGLGNKLGDYSVTGKKPQDASSQQKPEYLAALGLEWSSGLAWLVLEEGPGDAGDEQ